MEFIDDTHKSEYEQVKHLEGRNFIINDNVDVEIYKIEFTDKGFARVSWGQAAGDRYYHPERVIINLKSHSESTGGWCPLLTPKQTSMLLEVVYKPTLYNLDEYDKNKLNIMLSRNPVYYTWGEREWLNKIRKSYTQFL